MPFIMDIYPYSTVYFIIKFVLQCLNSIDISSIIRQDHIITRFENLELRMDNQDSRIENQNHRMDQYELLYVSLKHGYEAMISSIPADLVSRLEELLKKNDAVSAYERTVLEEKATIESNSELMEYYIAIQSYLNGLFLACGTISSGMVANQDSGKAATAAFVLEKIAQHAPTVPGVSAALDAVSPFLLPGASFAFDAASSWLSSCDDSIQKVRVERVMRVCRNDPVFISQISENVARKMALFLQCKLPSSGQVDSKLPGRSIPKRIQHCLDRFSSSEVKSTSKDQALKDVKTIIAAIMDGALTVKGGGDANTAAEAIVDLLRKLSRFRSR